MILKDDKKYITECYIFIICKTNKALGSILKVI